ncbi:hypothetical protein TKK_0014287 [Trichogramma kaykai]
MQARGNCHSIIRENREATEATGCSSYNTVHKKSTSQCELAEGSWRSTVRRRERPAPRCQADDDDYSIGDELHPYAAGGTAAGPVDMGID